MLSIRSSLSCIIHSVQVLWVAYVVLVGLVGLVTTVEGQVFSRHSMAHNPCITKPCPPPFECFNQAAGGRTCFNPNTGVTLDDHGVAALSNVNIKVWFDASDLNGNSVPDAEEGYVPASGLVDEWVSRVGGISATTTSTQIALHPTGMGGKPAVDFSAAWSSSCLFATPSDITLSPDLAVFVVMHIVPVDGVWQLAVAHSPLMSNTGGDGTGHFAVYARSSSTQHLLHLRLATITQDFTPDHESMLVSFFSDGTDYTGRVQGVSTGMLMNKQTSVDKTMRLAIGCGAVGNFRSQIAEIIIINGILPLSDVQAVEQYLMTKYSIT